MLLLKIFTGNKVTSFIKLSSLVLFVLFPLVLFSLVLFPLAIFSIALFQLVLFSLAFFQFCGGGDDAG